MLFLKMLSHHHEKKNDNNELNRYTNNIEGVKNCG